MAERARKLEDQTAQKTIHFLKQLLCDYHPRCFTIELWDGTRWEPDTEKGPRFVWRIKNPAILHAVTVSASQLALAEAYIYDDFDIEGDIEAVFPLADYLLNKRWSTKEKLRLRALLLGLPRRNQSRRVRPLAELNGPAHSKKRDRRAVSYHYDVSNDFYTLWLGKEMVYSGAYFRNPDDDLDTAQTQKLDLICRKLRLKPGERFLDIGCGWGGLVIHAAREYGVQALGITLSEQQLELAKKRIYQAGLSDRCEVSLLDYRDLGVPGTYDKVASVGMVEHVGESNLPEYFSRMFRLLGPVGLFLNCGIGRPGSRPAPDQPTFTDVYVFPDSELLPIAQLLRAAEDAGFEVRDVENFREHYAFTLHHWIRRLEAQADEARRLIGETKYRTWRLYLAGSEYYFQTGRLELYQTLLAKSEKSDKGCSTLPLTRNDS